MQGPAVIFGASGGIGAALADATEAQGYAPVLRLSRTHGDFDLTDEASIAACAARVAQIGAPRLILIATGLLSTPDTGPERAIRHIDRDWMLHNFAINAVGPALILKHMTPLLPKQGRAVVAALSARVGSISDNRLGGWHSYRASKAALNMLVKGAALELARTRPDALCVTLHPGTVATGLSAPFRTAAAQGVLPPAQAADHLLRVLDGLDPTHSGRCFGWDGVEIPA